MPIATGQKSKAMFASPVPGFYDQVPQHWMRDWPMPFPFAVAGASGTEGGWGPGGGALINTFPAGSSFPVSQGFDGGKTHLDEESRYAIDIVMPEGSPVHAVRDGVVMDVEEDFNAGGTDFEKYADKANHVRILHDDGTMALYAHLALARKPACWICGASST